MSADASADADLVAFDISWGSAYVTGRLPANSAARVISAAMQSDAVIAFPPTVSREDADRIRRSLR